MKITDEMRALIKEAVDAGRQAGRAESKREATPYQMTERRLYALPVLVMKITEDKEELQRLKDGGPMAERSKDIARFSKYGSRIDPEDKLDALICDMASSVAANEYEVDTMKKAIKIVEQEYYFRIIPGKYFDRLSDGELGAELSCDERTVRRQKNRLINAIAVFLYGAEAIR